MKRKDAQTPSLIKLTSKPSQINVHRITLTPRPPNANIPYNVYEERLKELTVLIEDGGSVEQIRNWASPRMKLSFPLLDPFNDALDFLATYLALSIAIINDTGDPIPWGGPVNDPKKVSRSRCYCARK